MNREERRQLYGRVRAGIATPQELKTFGKNSEYFTRRAQHRDEWRQTLRALVATSVPTSVTRNERKADLRARRTAKRTPTIKGVEVWIDGKRFRP